MRTALLLAVLPLVAAAACSDGAKTAPPLTGPTGTGAIAWTPLDDGLEQGTLQVPVDYAHPGGATFTLYMVRHLATDPSQRIGTLLVNPGGPGFGGSSTAASATSIYGDDVLQRFDILGWDPRGTGRSDPAIDCIDDYDRYYGSTDITPDDAAERQQIVDLAREFATACASENPTILSFVGTNNSARDMDSIRRALGETTISYFGFSYGSELGATWATMFPDTVRAAVLDGAADPNADSRLSALQQTKGFEDALDGFLAECSADDDCAFHNSGDAAGAFDRLMLSLDEQPIPTEKGRPALSRGIALLAAQTAMYDRQLWDFLATGLDNATHGDGQLLLSLYDSYYQRNADGTYPNTLEAFQAISCADIGERLTVEEEDAFAPQVAAVAPRVSPGDVGGYFCTFFPPAADPRITITGKGAGPILVMGTTGDPATPLASTENMAKALEDGRLVVVAAEQHTGYGANPCSISTVDEYLIDPTGHAPVSGTRCD